jgi:hypothetical protein
MKKTLLRLAPLPIAGASLWWALAQQAPAPLPSLFPAGALLYLETKDANSLVRDWDASTEKTAWLQSANYNSFSRSHLFLRLADAQTEFEQAAGLPPNYALLSSIAGGESAIALYNIGTLDFLYITRLPSARALNTDLWKARASFETRRAGNTPYYVKTEKTTNRTATFAYVGDLLLLSTREDAISGALELIARVNRPSIASEIWFQNATQAASAGDHDLRLVYNMDRLAPTPHFRSYWVQRNVPALREFSSGLADLERARNEIRERRVMLRSNPTPDASAAEPRAGQLLALAPEDAGLYRLTARPSSAQALHWIEEKLFSAANIAAPRSKEAPGAVSSDEVGNEGDLEIRIDEAPLSDSRSSQAFETLRAMLDGTPLDAMLEISSTGVAQDQVYVDQHAAVVFLSSTNWDANGVRNALTASATGLWTAAGLGAGWRAGANGAQELDGLGHLAFLADGQRLIIGDSTTLVNAIAQRRTRPAVAGAIYEASWRHSRELANFTRMFQLIDFPQIRPSQDGQDAEPMFFSGNLASIGNVFARVDSATITVHDVGTMLRENVIYRMR